MRAQTIKFNFQRLNARIPVQKNPLSCLPERRDHYTPRKASASFRGAPYPAPVTRGLQACAGTLYYELPFHLGE